MQHVWLKEIRAKILSGNRNGNRVGDTDVYGRILLKLILETCIFGMTRNIKVLF
jgi:hypothetical protein